MVTLSEREFIEIVTNHHPNSFSIGVERLAREYDIGYTEAVLAYCDKHEIEMDIAPKLINKPLKDKLENEARNLNLLPKIGLLPV